MKAYGLDLGFTDKNSIAERIALREEFPQNPENGTIVFLNTSFAGYDRGLYIFDGTSWLNGDISEVNAGFGLKGGGKSGAITLSIDPEYVPVKLSSTIKIFSSIPVLNGLGTIAYSNDIPSSQDGDEIQGVCITPSVPNSKFLLEFSGIVDCSQSARYISICLYANNVYLGRSITYLLTSDQPQHVFLRCVYESSNQTQCAFSLRIGTNTEASEWFLGRGAITTIGNSNQSVFSIQELI